MNYIALANRFWKLHTEQGFAPGESHLYFCLLNLFNSKGEKTVWPEEVNLTDGALAAAAGVDVKFIERNRRKIEERGLIFSQSAGKGVRFGRTYRLLDNTFTSPRTSPKMGEETAPTSPITSPKMGEVNELLPPQPPPQPTPKWGKSLYIGIPNLNPNTLSLKKNAGEVQATEEILSIEAEEVMESDLNADSKNTPLSGAPPQPDYDEETGLAELHAFVGKLSSQRRLIEMLSRLNKLKGQEALDWIERFVTRQWGGDNLREADGRERPMKDLIFHCQSWIEQQLSKPTRSHEQSTYNNRRRQGPQQSRAETGSEIDRLAEEYFGT